MTDSERFGLLNEAFEPEQVGDRLPSAAMLAWFLINVERLDPELVPEAICDGPNDKGFDAIVVDDELNEITLFQAKRMESITKTQGDQDLKNFVGSSHYFVNKESVQALLDNRPNLQLRNLLIRNDVVAKVAKGYKVRRLVYVTNATLNAAGAGYVDARKGAEPVLDVWHGGRLVAVAELVRRSEMRDEPVTLHASTEPIIDPLDGKASLAVALIPATELVSLPGIEDMTLFSRNVRLYAGNTRINRELSTTVANEDEHELFPAAHNGITVLTLGLENQGSELTLSGVSVVNGCQSLIALYRAQERLTEKLKLLVKIVVLPDATSDLSDVITYRANNQNAVNIRDQRSTDRIQLELQRSVREAFGKRLAYTVKVGEKAGADDILDNTLAAQLIMATYRAKPWAAVRKVRLFDHDYHAIFAPDITAHCLYLVHLINIAVNAARDDLKGELRSSFASVRFAVASLLAEILRGSQLGMELLRRPEGWLPDQSEEVLAYLTERARDVVISLNSHVEVKAASAVETGDDFDPKTVFKSAAGINPLKLELLTLMRHLDQREAGFLFSTPPEK